MDEIDPLANSGGQDDDLDSFFAKKDKKGKKKKKKNVVNTEELAKTLEKVSMNIEGEQTEEEKKEEEKKIAEDKDQNEWHDYDDENDRDYSDLKIQNFQISELEKQNAIEQQKYDEAGELIVPKPIDGPWKKVDDEVEVNEGLPKPIEQPSPPKRETTTAPDSSASTLSSYVPPHMRRSQTQSTTTPRPSAMWGRKQEAPKLQSEIDFPTLSAAATDTEVHRGFETVKQGSRSSSWEQSNTSSQPNVLKLGNQFSALRN